MTLTFFSVMMATMFSTLFILIIHFFRYREFFLRTFGIHTVLFLYLLCAVRMMFAVELPFTKIIRAEIIYNPVYLAVSTPQVVMRDFSSTFLDLLLLVWAIGALGLTLKFFLESFRVSRKLRAFPGETNALADRVLSQVQAESKYSPKVKIQVCENISIPAGSGIFHKVICLPDRAYSEKELYYIIKHEYIHFCNRDLEIKFLIRLFCCLFWWNPAVYLLKRDVDRILEIKCDSTATENFSKESKLEYLTAILHSIAEAGLKKCDLSSQSSIHLFSSEDEVIERFELVSRPIQKRAKLYQAAFMLTMLFILVLSYSFVFQSAFEPPSAESSAGPDDICYEVDTTDAYIIENSDGEYYLVLEDGTKISIFPEVAQIYIDGGFTVKER